MFVKKNLSVWQSRGKQHVENFKLSIKDSLKKLFDLFKSFRTKILRINRLKKVYLRKLFVSSKQTKRRQIWNLENNKIDIIENLFLVNCGNCLFSSTVSLKN